MLSNSQISAIITLLEKSGKEILAIYEGNDFNTRMKEDNSPVTLADIASDKIIKAGLNEISPGIPVFSEETKEVSYKTRSKWDPLWILDPLDGTKEFIAKNNEFCISLALVSHQQPVAGFIHSPVSSETWMAVKGKGAFKLKKGRKIPLPFLTPGGAYRIIVSRSHYNAKEAGWIENIRKYHDAMTTIQGSAIKFCRIAEGIADLYPKFGLIHEWDVAAGHLIIEESGGSVIETATGKPPVYNKENYFQSPFIAFGARVKDWEK